MLKQISKIGVFCSFLLMLFFIPAAMAAVDTSSPYKKMQIAANTIFTTINSESAEIKRNPDMLKTIVRKDLLPYVHVKYAAALVLGSRYKDLTPAQRDDYFSAFENYLVQAFAQALSLYDGQKYQIESEKDLGDKTMVSVRVLLTNPDNGQPPIRIDFQWRKNTATGEWQAYDLIAEGVSMITTKQSEWATLVRQQGIDALIKQLQILGSEKIDPNEKPASNTN